MKTSPMEDYDAQHSSKNTQSYLACGLFSFTDLNMWTLKVSLLLCDKIYEVGGKFMKGLWSRH